ncbi:hypothetical protein RhiirA5_431121 [Rhizophagus irregularis]|uniref:Uncharacterized protein n=1 Tax=Rhizophagus irregularis TaxID=588596 RepID=A0A2N0NVN0_9GLOM|nr:hypothetical protein RhiirA5_431121 [Rhizophagus irregularis]
MNNVELKQIKINCYISDSAGEHATARCQLRIEYSNKVFLSLSYITHQMNLVESAKGLAPELSRLALQLFGICVNATSVKCLWSNMGFFAFKMPKLATFLAMAQLQKYESEDDDENNDDSKFTFNAFNDSDTEELEETSIIDNCNVNDTFEEYDNNNILNPEQWIKIIKSWIEMVNTENDSNNLDSREVEPYDFEVGRHDTHPADNPLVKWKLLELFLEAPIYMVQ